MFVMAIDQDWMPFFDLDVGPDSAEWRNLDGKDYASYSPTTAKRLTDAPIAGNALPDGAWHAFIAVEANPIRIRVGSVDATATNGLLLPVGTTLTITNQREFLKRISFIDTAAGASKVSILYGRRP
jgi:hypothetical protein